MNETEYKQLQIDATNLMKNELFQKVILNNYIAATASDIGTRFSGSQAQQDELKAITHLSNHLNSLTGI